MREEGGLQVPSPHSLHKGPVPNGQWLGPRQPTEETAECCRCRHQGLQQESQLHANTDVCRVANELCWFKNKNKNETKKKANTNLKTWIKPKRAQAHTG